MKPRLTLMVAVISLAVGCTEKATTKQFKVTASWASGIKGGPAIRYEWTIAKDGPCKGTVYRGSNDRFRKEEVKRYTLPPESFQELQQILIETRFFDTKPGRQNAPTHEDPNWHIEVESHEKKHQVGFFGKPLPQFQKLCEFISTLPDRGQEVKEGDKPPKEK